jgi:hypothetical protein
MVNGTVVLGIVPVSRLLFLSSHAKFTSLEQLRMNVARCDIAHALTVSASAS